MLRHPDILGGPQQRGQNQKLKPKLGVHHDAPSLKKDARRAPGALTFPQQRLISPQH